MILLMIGMLRSQTQVLWNEKPEPRHNRDNLLKYPSNKF